MLDAIAGDRVEFGRKIGRGTEVVEYDVERLAATIMN